MSDTTAAESTTISSVKLVICNTLKNHGVDPAPLCQAVGLNVPDVTHLMRRDPTSKIAQLMDLAAEVTGDPAFALEVARNINITTFSSYGAAVITSTTLGTALRHGQRFSKLISNTANFEIIDYDDRLMVRLVAANPELSLHPHLCLLYIASGIQVGRTLSSSFIVPLEIRLEQPEPVDTEPYTAFFGRPVLFGQTENSGSWHLEGFNTPIAPQDPRLSQLAHDLAAKDLNKLTAHTVADEVCVHIENSLAEGEPKIAVVASSLGLSPRSLQRKLAAEKHTFAQLLDNTRKRMAHEMVLKPSEQIKNLAYDLGFSDQSNFNRAFKRWYGISPTEYRRRINED